MRGTRSIGLAVCLLLGVQLYALPVQWPSSAGGNDHWYELYPTYLQWEDLNVLATSLSYLGMPGYIVTIQSQAENDFLFQTFFGMTDQFWIGYSDAVQEGSWVWSTGEPTTYTHWSPSEPNDLNGEDYAVFVLAYDHPSFWNDVGADAYQLGVVEYGSVPEPATILLTIGGALLAKWKSQRIRS